MGVTIPCILNVYDMSTVSQHNYNLPRHVHPVVASIAKIPLNYRAFGIHVHATKSCRGQAAVYCNVYIAAAQLTNLCCIWLVCKRWWKV